MYSTHRFYQCKKGQTPFWIQAALKSSWSHWTRIHPIHNIGFSIYCTKDNDTGIYFTQNPVSVVPTVLHTSRNEKYRVEHFGLRIYVHAVLLKQQKDSKEKMSQEK